MSAAKLNDVLAKVCLRTLGHFAITPEDDLGAGQTLVMVGPDEPDFWTHFSDSPEYKDGAPDPLDRWSKREITAIATNLGGTAHFPFGGPPYKPFYTWALRTNHAWASPIGFLVHADAGLFVSYRAALVLPFELPETSHDQPCNTCAKPCHTACPVGAFNDGYDVAACKTHINSEAGQDCVKHGCKARLACPVGQGRRLSQQAEFHMKAFQ